MRVTTVPTWEQMRVLADRAEQGLTPAEADRLRAGLAHVAATRIAAGWWARRRVAAAEAERDVLARALASLTGQTVRQVVAHAQRSAARRVPGQRPPAATTVRAESASDTAGLNRTGPEKGAVRPPKALSAIRRPPPGTASRAAV